MEVTRVIFRMTIATILMALALSQVLLPPHPPFPSSRASFSCGDGGLHGALQSIQGISQGGAVLL